MTSVAISHLSQSNQNQQYTMADSKELKEYSSAEVQSHDKEADIWMIIGNETNGKYENSCSPLIKR